MNIEDIKVGTILQWQTGNGNASHTREFHLVVSVDREKSHLELYSMQLHQTQTFGFSWAATRLNDDCWSVL